MHPHNALSALASIGLLAAACSGGDSDQPLGGASGSGASAGAGNSAGTGGSVVTPPGASGGGDTGGSGGGSAGGSGGGSAGGSGGSSGAGGGNTGGSSGSASSSPCNGTPTSCADIGADEATQYYGCCDGETVYWCDDQSGNWEIHGVDCASQGQSCDYDASYESMWCVGGTGGSGGGTGGSGGTGAEGACNGTPSTCTDIGADQASQYYGCCQGDMVYWCDDQSGTWELHDADCASQGQSCKYDGSYDSMWCVDESVGPVEPGDPPGPGPGPTCANLPPLECTGSNCAALVPFDPDSGDGYIDYPENGETASNQYRSYIRRDLMMLIKYAAAKVACKTAGWKTGNGQPLGLIDMSESNGAIPGTSIGSPGHPDGTHVNGRDIDVAYYQTASSPDNRARPVCEHVTGGQDAYHCTAEPHLLDAWRNAAFLGFIFEHPSARVVGADGKVGPHLDAALDYLCQNGWLTSYACSNRKLTYEVTNQGYGWYYFHHHHMHVSFTPPSYSSSIPMSLDPKCLIESCDAKAWSNFLQPYGL